MSVTQLYVVEIPVTRVQLLNNSSRPTINDSNLQSVADEYPTLIDSKCYKITRRQFLAVDCLHVALALQARFYVAVRSVVCGGVSSRHSIE